MEEQEGLEQVAEKKKVRTSGISTSCYVGFQEWLDLETLHP